LDYEDIDISLDEDRAREMVERSGRRTVPQIFINNESIGGFDELSQLSMESKLG
jgi:glutaredoxin